MEFTFYVAGLFAILTTIKVITHTNPIHALLYLIVSLLALSIVFFSVGSYFAGALEIIIYAGAIMVLFIFVVMILNLGKSIIDQERISLHPKMCIGPAIISIILLSIIIYAIIGIQDGQIKGDVIDVKMVGINLFSSYMIGIELVSLLLIASLVIVFHIGRQKQLNHLDNNCNMEKKT
ncbi:MAG: NADH-quinone oxidoreductase subunit J [Arsenophonus sp.]